MTTALRQHSTLHRLYGLSLLTSIPVGERWLAPFAEDGWPTVDWTVLWTDPPEDPTLAPEGVPVLSEGVWSAVRNGGIVTLWHVQLGRIHIDLDSSRISLGLTRRTDEAGALLLRGVVLALALELRGVSCLHANGMIIGDRAIAVAGPRGVGKTTVTAALCAAGLDLLSDDVVAVERHPSSSTGWLARAGLTQLRLRTDASHLADLIGVRAPQRVSVDGRRVVSLPAPVRQVLPLIAIVIPRIDPTIGRPVLAPMRRREAFASVAVSFRIPTFLDASLSVSRLGVTAELAHGVPVHMLRMPHRSTWTAADAAALREAVERVVDVDHDHDRVGDVDHDGGGG